MTASHTIFIQQLLSGGILALVRYLAVVLAYLKIEFALRDTLPRSLQDLVRALTIAITILIPSTKSARTQHPIDVSTRLFDTGDLAVNRQEGQVKKFR